MFDTGFLANWQAELKEMNKGKERGNISLSEFLDIAACHRLTRLLATIHAAEDF